MVRSPLDLVDLPFTFTQLDLITADGFRTAARDRGVVLADTDLELLHRQRLLVPFFRVRRDTRSERRLLKRRRLPAYLLSNWQPSSRSDLQDANDAGALFDPARDRFRSAQERERWVDGFRYQQSVYLYAHHQLVQLPLVKTALAYRRQDTNGISLRVERRFIDQWRKTAERLREIAIAATALEPIYYPDIVGRVRLVLTPSMRPEIETYDAWLGKVRPTSMLRWLDINAAWLTDAAAELLDLADCIDPLGDWSEVVTRGTADAWGKLKREARNAIDIRVTAELLLLYYDRLVRARRARAINPPAGRVPGRFQSRLKAQRPLDAVLTEFGLSPHPSLVLVLEGATEVVVFGHLMQKFGIRRDEDFMSIQDAEGVGRDLSSLAAFVAPRVTLDTAGGSLDLQRPATRILVVFDAEGSVTTAKAREDRRKELIDRMLRTLPREQRDRIDRSAVDPLVHLETWNPRGDSFEFAHFTDRQIAKAILSVPGRHERRSLDATIATVGRLRAQRGNLKSAVSGKKLELAEALWPTLDRRIDRQLVRRTETRIPIVRVIDRALALANELPRRNLAIPLSTAGPAR